MDISSSNTNEKEKKGVNLITKDQLTSTWTDIEAECGKQSKYVGKYFTDRTLLELLKCCPEPQGTQPPYPTYSIVHPADCAWQIYNIFNSTNPLADIEQLIFAVRSCSLETKEKEASKKKRGKKRSAKSMESSSDNPKDAKRRRIEKQENDDDDDGQDGDGDTTMTGAQIEMKQKDDNNTYHSDGADADDWYIGRQCRLHRVSGWEQGKLNGNTFTGLKKVLFSKC